MTKHVLLVDDHPMVLKALARLLERRYRVTTAQTGDELRERLGVLNGVDAVICDLQMPDATADELLDTIRDHDPSLVSRTVFMTGGAMDDRAHAFLSRLRTPVLQKPFSMSGLADALRRLPAAC
jgi:CheY-like chemotaxis protein